MKKFKLKFQKGSVALKVIIVVVFVIAGFGIVDYAIRKNFWRGNNDIQESKVSSEESSRKEVDIAKSLYRAGYNYYAEYAFSPSSKIVAINLLEDAPGEERALGKIVVIDSKKGKLPDVLRDAGASGFFILSDNEILIANSEGISLWNINTGVVTLINSLADLQGGRFYQTSDGKVYASNIYGKTFDPTAGSSAGINITQPKYYLLNTSNKTFTKMPDAFNLDSEYLTYPIIWPKKIKPVFDPGLSVQIIEERGLFKLIAKKSLQKDTYNSLYDLYVSY